VSVVALLVAVVAAPALTMEGNRRADGELLPVAALDAAAEAAVDKVMWNSYDYGGYLIWVGAPQGLLVSMDGRTDLYGDDRVRQHIETWLGRGESSGFVDPSVEIVVVERAAPLAEALSGSGFVFSAIDGDKVRVLLRVSE
jgi:hypothetical protein